MLEIEIPAFKFTGNPSTYTDGVGYLVNQALLLQSPPTISLQLRQKDSGGTSVNTYSDPGWTNIDDSGTHYVESNAEIVISSVVGGTDVLYVETTSGVGIVALGQTGSFADGCAPWFPASYLQWRT